MLDRLTREQPDRIYFKSLFNSGSLSEVTICNVCLRPTQPLCNYTDLRTGEPWFCYKPKNLSCDARINHVGGGYKQNLKDEEEKLFQRWGTKRGIKSFDPEELWNVRIKRIIYFINYFTCTFFILLIMYILLCHCRQPSVLEWVCTSVFAMADLAFRCSELHNLFWCPVLATLNWLLASIGTTAECLILFWIRWHVLFENFELMACIQCVWFWV